jgi:hypothetical protein
MLSSGCVVTQKLIAARLKLDIPLHLHTFTPSHCRSTSYKDPRFYSTVLEPTVIELVLQELHVVGAIISGRLVTGVAVAIFVWSFVSLRFSPMSAGR